MFKSKKEYEKFLKENIMTTKQAANYLDMTRSGISYLVKNDKLTPLIDQRNVRLFSKREIKMYKEKRNK